MVHLKYIASRRDPALWETTMTSMQRAVEAALEQASKGLEIDVSKGLLSLDHGQFEEIAIQTLSPYSTYYDWKKDVSCPNEYGQTLAHLAVTLGYIRLLEQLISWEIDLSVRDTTGATALHFAYLYDHPECVSLLTRSGANQQIPGEPGRKASAMTCPGDSGASFSGTLDGSSDLTCEHATSVTDREELLGTERVSGPKRPREKNGFDPRLANLLECGANSLGSTDSDLNSRSPSTGPTDTGAVEVQPPGVIAQGLVISLLIQTALLMLVSPQDSQTANKLPHQGAVLILRRDIPIQVRAKAPWGPL
jgi:ankyrin repeat protein